MFRGVGLRKTVEQPVLDLNFAAAGALDSRITFSRGTSATFVGSNGLIQTAGNNVARFDHDPTWFMSAAQEQNLFQHSETIDDSFWEKVRTNVTANAIAAPDGTVTAELLSEDSNSGTHIVRQNTPADVPQTAGKSYVFSGYLKAGSRTKAKLKFESGAHEANIDLTAGTITNDGFDSVSISDEGNGWFRFAAVETADVTNDPLIQLALRNDSGASSYTGDGSSGLYVWGLQLEVGTSPGTYHRTEGAPYYGEGATPRGLLVEEARTNLVDDSEDFTSSQFNSARLTLTADSSIAPDGTNTATEIVPTTDNNTHLIRWDDSVTSGTTYTASLFVKQASGDANIRLLFNNTNSGFGFSAADFDLSAGTVNNVSCDSASIEAYGNGWFRCSVTEAATASVTGRVQFNVTDSSGTSSYAGDGTAGIFIWGFQIEEGSFPTRYIKTTGSTATRNADVAVMGPTTGGTELVTNGTFDTDVSNWVEYNANSSITYSSGTAIISSNQYNDVRQVLSLVEGRRYRASMDVITRTSGSWFFLLLHDSTSSNTGGAFADGSTQTFDFTAGAVNTLRIYPYTTGNPDTIKVDNISVRELYPFEQYNPAEGTVVSDHADVKSGNVIWGAVNDDGKSFNDTFYFTSEDLVVRSGSSSTASISQSENSTGKIAGAFKENSIQKASDGVAGTEDTSAALPSKGIDRFTFGLAPWSNGNYICGTLKRISFYDRRLPDETLEALTND